MFHFLQNYSYHIQELAKIYDISHARIVLGWLCEKISGKSSSVLMVNQLIWTQEYEEILNNYIHRLVIEQYPLQYILETMPFGDLELVMKEPVLIARPETQEWVVNVLQSLAQYKNAHLTILDLCTGSGCIALSVAHYFKNSIVHAVDLYDDPLALTQLNCIKNKIKNVTIIKSDLFHNLQPHSYNIIFSNPPYIDENVWNTLDPVVKKWEDKNALVGDNKGLAFYEKIIKEAPMYLKKESVVQDVARLYLEIGYDQKETVTQLFKKQGFNTIECQVDFAGHDRMISACL